MDAADFALAGGSPVGGTYSGTGVAAGNFSQLQQVQALIPLLILTPMAMDV